MARHPKQQQFFEAIGPSGSLCTLFEHLPGVSFFAKNAQFEIVCANSAFLEHVGVAREGALIGRTDYELFPKSLADHFRADDAWVMQHRKPRLHIVELFINPDGLPDWYLTNKLPVFSGGGGVVGVMGTTQSYESDKRSIQPYLRIEPAIQFIRQHFREKILIMDVAAKAHLSVRQLDRRFQEILKMSPQEFITRLRIKTACEELSQGRDSILDIAVSLGFYDQSSFSLQFRRRMGITPLQYRKQHQSGEVPVAPLEPRNSQ
ncbi:MAG TPA: AraC family transcriptional regulator [Verrucomicrobiales bacterium]|nr:AraC family transcriptional regulator [Verrucomicrobiales bacterium]